MRDNLISQLESSLLLGTLSLIPNDTLRYTLLAIVFCFSAVYVIRLKRPSTQLSQLEDKVKKTEKIIRQATSYCGRDFFKLAEQGVRLSKVKRAISVIRCRAWKTNTLTWKKYRLLSRDIAACSIDVKNIRTAVQLIVEAERQRRYTEDINETEIMLSGLPSPGIGVITHQPNILYSAQQSYSV